MSSNPREVYVLDCSQVCDRAGFWDCFLRELPVQSPEYFGRNLDALWDALSAEGPGWPGPVWIELHNVEQLEKVEEGAFLEALETIAAALVGGPSGVRLSVIRRGTPSRGGV